MMDCKACARAFSAVFLLVLPIFGASPLLGEGKGCFGGTIESVSAFDQPLALGLLAASALIAVAYMIGKSWQQPKLSVWAKNEVYYLAISVVLIFAVIGIFSASCVATQQFAGLAPSQNPANVASRHLEELTNTFGLTIATELVQSSISDQFAAMPYAYWGFPWDPGGGGGTAYLASQKAWSSHKEVLSGLYIPLLVSIQVQRMALEALITGVLSLLLPAALVLRMFFITRDVGNFLIALAFSIYLFVPLTYVMAQQATEQVVATMEGDEENPFEGIGVAKDKIIGDAYQRIGFLATQAILIPNLVLVMLVTSTVAINKSLKGLVG